MSLKMIFYFCIYSSTISALSLVPDKNQKELILIILNKRQEKKVLCDMKGRKLIALREKMLFEMPGMICNLWKT